MRVIFHVDLDEFFVGVERALDFRLRGKPVVVMGRKERGVVASASYEARAYGICAGMPLSLAYRLCPQAIFIEGRFSLYKEFSDKFFAILSCFTPDIEPAGIDEAYLDLTGFEPLYGQPKETAKRIKQRINEELGLTASIGIAPSKLVAKVASDLSKPDGLLEVVPGEEANFLSPLPVRLLPGVGPKAEKVLKGIGVRTIGELASLSPSFLQYLFGTTGLMLHQYANGIDNSPVEPPPEAKSISRSITLSKDTLDRSFLEAVLSYLSEEVGAELRSQRKKARCIILKLRYADFETLQRQKRLKAATDDDRVIFGEGKGLLEGILSQRNKLVRLIGIGVSQLEMESQLFLWEGERRKALYWAIDSLRQKYGFDVLRWGRTLPLKGVLAF